MADGSQTEAEDGWHPIWKWLGIGCAVIALVGAAGLAFGTWKFVSCCGDYIDLSQRTAKASKIARAFGQNIQEGKYEAALMLTTSDYRKQHSLESFRNRLKPHRETLQNPSAPRLESIEPVEAEDVTKIREWRATLVFAKATARQRIEMQLKVDQIGMKEGKKFLISTVDVSTSKRRLRDEPPARMVSGFWNQLGTDNLEGLYHRMSETYREQNSKKAFDDMLSSLRSLRTEDSKEISFENVFYETSNKVSIHSQIGTSESKVIRWELSKKWGNQWKIDSFTTEN